MKQNLIITDRNTKQHCCCCLRLLPGSSYPRRSHDLCHILGNVHRPMLQHSPSATQTTGSLLLSEVCLGRQLLNLYNQMECLSCYGLPIGSRDEHFHLVSVHSSAVKPIQLLCLSKNRFHHWQGKAPAADVAGIGENVGECVSGVVEHASRDYTGTLL